MKYIREISILIFFFITNALAFGKLKKKMANILHDYENIDKKIDLLREKDNEILRIQEKVKHKFFKNIF